MHYGIEGLLQEDIVDIEDYITSSQDLSLLKSILPSAKVDIAEISRYSSSSAQNILDMLLEGGHITPAEYLARIPAGVIPEKDSLIEAIPQRGSEKDVAKGESIYE